jgi:sugar-specific transcriptional regulator TrmB
MNRTNILKSFYERLLEQNKYTICDLAKKLGVHYNTVYALVRKNIITSSFHPGRKAYICVFNPDNIKERLKKEYDSGGTTKFFYNKIINCIKEVQYEF